MPEYLEADEIFMSRCLQLAASAAGNVAPNPMVGCVITIPDELAPFGQKIIGEGYHEQYGGPHAEVNAINSVSDQRLLRQARLYVSLEPCTHFGKTPPCADLIREKEIPEVVVGCTDPNAVVAGKGIKMLREAGVKVKSRILEQQAVFLNRRFFTYQQAQRPYIILKWAQTKDGFLARKDHSSKWISNRYSRAFVHKLRSEESAIMVGTNTALFDNPSLNVRDWTGKDPIRVVMDNHLKIPHTSKLYVKTGQAVVFNNLKNGQEGNILFYKMDTEGNSLLQVIKQLYEMEVLSLIVEGGASLLQSFIDENLWDEARVFTSNTYFNEGISAPLLRQAPAEERTIDNDILTYYLNNNLNRGNIKDATA